MKNELQAGEKRAERGFTFQKDFYEGKKYALIFSFSAVPAYNLLGQADRILGEQKNV
jgi:hypothetical protein